MLTCLFCATELKVRIPKFLNDSFVYLRRPPGTSRLKDYTEFYLIRRLHQTYGCSSVNAKSSVDFVSRDFYASQRPRCYSYGAVFVNQIRLRAVSLLLENPHAPGDDRKGLILGVKTYHLHE